MDSRATTRTRLSILPVFIAIILNLMAPLVPSAASPAAALTGSSFDATDGNLVVNDAETDWCSPGLVVTRKDDLPTGQTDDSYAEGAKENDLNPAVETGSIPNNKVDLQRTYIASETAGGDLFVYVAFVRSDTTGTGTVSFELNQSDVTLSNGVNRQRTVGDLLIEFDFKANPGSQGGYDVTLSYRTWTGTEWSNALSLAGFADGSVNEFDSIIDCLNGDEVLGEAQFGEFALNLTDLLGGDCRAFVSLFAKSRSSNVITSTLKDLIKPADVNFSTCGQLTILKQDATGAALGGATFSITPNPFTKTGTLSVTDNVDPDDNPANGTIHLSDVEPGVYTVCETEAPDGYIGDPNCQVLTVADNGAATFTFVNTLSAISWTKLDDETSLKLCCATFTLEGIAGPALGYSLTVTDDGPDNDGLNDEDPDAGELLVSGLLLGTYRITESVAPAGYALPSPAFQDVVLDGDPVTGSPANAFRDPPIPVLDVEKTPDQGSATSGDTTGFTIVTTNNGPGTALAVTLTDPLPATENGWTVSSENWAGDCSITGDAGSEQDLTCGPESLAMSQSRSVTVETTFTDSECDVLNNTATADGSNTIPADDSGSIDPLCPLIDVDKTPDDGEVNAPGTATFSIVTTNLGDGEARGTTLFDDLPEVAGGWTIDSSDWAGCAISDAVHPTEGSIGEWLSCGPETIAGLGGDNTRTVAVSASVTTDDCGPLDNLVEVTTSNDGSDDDAGLITVECPDLDIDKTADAETVDAGDPIGFSIVVSNNDVEGTGTATNVALDDLLPGSTALGVSWSIDAVSFNGDLIDDQTLCSISGDAPAQTLECTFGDMAPGDEYEVELSSDTSAPGGCLTADLFNEATAVADNHEEIDSDATITVECPDLDIDKTADADVVSAGQPIGFSVEVSNSSADGTGTASGVTLEDLLPGGDGINWSVVEVTLNGVVALDPAAWCSIAGDAPAQTLECNFNDMAPGDDAIVHVMSGTTSDSCAAYDNTAVADALNAGEVTSLEATTIVECPGLNLVKTADADPIDAGDEASFTITVWNAGPGDAFDVELHDDLPAGMAWDFEVVSGDAIDADCIGASSLSEGGVLQMSIDCEFGTLGVTDMAGGIVIRVFADTDRADCGTLTNSASADGSNLDEPLTAGDSIEVRCPEITLDKENDAVGSVLPGTTVTYTLTLTVDDGPADDVMVVDSLPVGLENPTSISNGGVFDDATSTITWDLGDLADGEYVLTYQATVADDVENGEELVNAAAATSTNSQCPDLETLGPDCEDDSTVIVRVPTLAIDKVADAELITITGEAGDLEASPSIVTWTLTYTLTNGPVTNAVITDEIPAGFVFLDASDGGLLVDGTVTWTFATLSASGSVTFRTTVDPETVSRVAPTVNVAVIDSDETEPDEGQDSVTVVVEPPVLGGNPTPTPKPNLPDTASGIGLNGEPVTVPLELLVALFGASLSAMTLANVKARSRRR